MTQEAQAKVQDSAEMKSLKQLRESSRLFLLRLIENDIEAGLLFVRVARNAQRVGNDPDVKAAIAKAEAIHAQASQIAHGSSHQQPELTERLQQLRQAIDSVSSE